LGCFSEEYLAAAHLKKMSLQHGAAQELLSENEIGEFLKRTNVKNFVVSFHVVTLCSSPHYDVGTFPYTPRFLDQDLCPEDVAILPKKLQFADSNAQSMDCLNALLQKKKTHDIEVIDFDSSITVGYGGVEKVLKAQEEVIHNIATRCPKLQYLCRFSRKSVFLLSLLHIAQDKNSLLRILF
jgi:hypothetical protein